jgi:hypothetical protein
VRGMAMGALVGAAIAGTALLQRRRAATDRPADEMTDDRPKGTGAPDR